MWKSLLLVSALSLSACSLTPEQAHVLGEAMRSGGEGMAQGAQTLRQRQHELRLQQASQPLMLIQPTRCETRFSQLTNSYITQCN
jgi:hypothetical protein